MFKGLLTTGVNGLMAMLLLGMLALPITSIGLAGIRNNLPQTQVLSAQDEMPQECVCPKFIITPEMERDIYEKVLNQMEEEGRKSDADAREIQAEIMEEEETEEVSTSNLE